MNICCFRCFVCVCVGFVFVLKIDQHLAEYQGFDRPAGPPRPREPPQFSPTRERAQRPRAPPSARGFGGLRCTAQAVGVASSASCAVHANNNSPYINKLPDDLRKRSLPSGHLFSDVGAIMLREVGRGRVRPEIARPLRAERSGTECEAVFHWEATRGPESGHHCK